MAGCFGAHLPTAPAAALTKIVSSILTCAKTEILRLSQSLLCPTHLQNINKTAVSAKLVGVTIGEKKPDAEHKEKAVRCQNK
jgi:hypothetical protein